MKFTVSMKDPDTLHDAIEGAVKEELQHSGLPQDEQDILIEARKDKIADLCSKWFEYGEYLRVEIDTDASTCTVLPVKH